MKLIFSEKCLEYSQLGHPESPERVKKAHDFLRDKCDFLEPKPASDEDLLRVHSKNWIETVKILWLRAFPLSYEFQNTADYFILL